jgi:protease-4
VPAGWICAIVVAALLAFFAFQANSCVRALAFDGGEVYEPNSIAVINLSGSIAYDGSACSPEGIKQLLDQAEADDNIKGVVLRVNSGGGTATAGEEMAAYVRDFSKPITVSSASLNASAAYEISSQADYIYVAHTTDIGSIGTVMQTIDYSGLLDLLGIKVDNIASAESKDSTYGSRPLTDEERAYYPDQIDQVNRVFVQNVAQGRGMTVDAVDALATGLTFTGDEAVENGLADAVGSREDAVKKAADLAGVGDNYHTTTLALPDDSLADMLGLSSSTHQSDGASALAAAIKELTRNDGTAD